MNILLGHPIFVTSPAGTRTMSVSDHPADYAAEWGFVLQHSATIERFSARLCVDDRLQPDELRQEAIEWIVRLHGSFDPSRAAASSWIYFMVRRARQAMLVQLNRRDANEVGTDPRAAYGEPGYSPERGDQGSAAERTERIALLSRVYDRATVAERSALDAALLDPDSPKVMRAIRALRSSTRLELYAS